MGWAKECPLVIADYLPDERFQDWLAPGVSRYPVTVKIVSVPSMDLGRCNSGGWWEEQATAVDAADTPLFTTVLRYCKGRDMEARAAIRADTKRRLREQDWREFGDEFDLVPLGA